MIKPLAHALLLLIALVAIAPTARADGKIFTTLQQQPTIPTQSALIAWDGTRQTLAIETTFTDPGSVPESDYAWVVPVPSEPELKAATTGLFPTLRAITGPRIDDGRNGGLWLLLPAALLALAVWMLVWLPFPVAGRVVAAGFAVIVLGFACMPMFSRARSMQSVASADVEVLSAQPVGSYDTAVIRSDTGDAIAAWLTDAGFTIPPEARPVLDAYAKEGWCFVAARLRAPSSVPADRIVPHPIAMTFAASAPIYPMRLTGVGASADLQLDLYIFATGKAAIPGFTTIESDRTIRDTGSYMRTDGAVPVEHDGLASLVGAQRHFTLLRRTLKPAEMSTDIPMSFVPFEPEQATFYTRKGAMSAAAPKTALALIVLSLLMAILRCTGHSWAKAMLHAAIPIAAAAIILLAAPMVLPVVSATRAYPLQRAMAAETIAELVSGSREHDTKPVDMSWEEWARQLAARYAREEFESDSRIEIPIEQDSPGNYIIRSRPDGRAEIAAINGVGRIQDQWLTVPPDDHADDKKAP